MLLFITLIVIINANLIKNPPLRIINEKIETNNFTRQAKEKLSIQYGAYPGVFAVDLHKRINGQIGQQSYNIDDFEKVEIDEQYGCYAVQQNIKINFDLKIWLDRTGVTRDIYFTDLATSENSSRVYVVRNDFTLFSINVDKGFLRMQLDQDRQSFAQLLDYNEDDIDNHPFLIDDNTENKIYIITQNGAASFNTDSPLNLITIQKESNFKKRDKIFNIHYNVKHKLIYIACGYQGLDVYKINNQSQLIHVSYITTSELQLINGQVIDVDSNGDDYLYVLDKEIGLIFYKIHNLESGQVSKIFTIQISNTKNFDHYGSTFFIVAKTVNKQDYAVEVFVDQANHYYYFNNYYIDEMTINDVNVFQYYAVLIGDDGHKIVQHSIYSGFLDDKLISHTSFQDPDLFKVKEYEYDQQRFMNIRLLVGIAKYEFKIFSIRMNHPTVDCIMEDAEINEYIVLLNSTNCNGKSQLPEGWLQLFTLCNITHQFTFTTTQLPGNYYSYAYYTIIIYVLFVIVVWVLIFMYICFKKWGHKLSFLAWKKKIVDATAPYNESFDVKEQEMSDQSNQQKK